MVRFYSILICLLSYLTSSGQGLPGSVITLQGDTLRGMVVEKSGQQRVQLYTEPRSQPRTFSPDQLRGYSVRRGFLIRSAVVRQATDSVAACFVVARQLGRASVYAYADETGLLLQPSETDTLYELTKFNWHLLLNRHLSGCPSLDFSNGRILDITFTDPHVLQLVARYNVCLEPTWQAGTLPRQSIWTKGIGVRAGYAHVFRKATEDNQAVSGSGRYVGAEWVGLRASGLQASISGTYTDLTAHTPYYSLWLGRAMLQQEKVRTQMLSVGGSIGKRIGQPRRPGLFVGFGMSFDYQLQQLSETWEQQAGSGDPIRTGTFRTSGNLSMHLDALAGVVAPVGPRQDIRLLAVYQHYIVDMPRTIGVQAVYSFFWK